MRERVAVLGAGTMGEAVLSGAIKADWPADQITATIRPSHNAQFRAATLRDTYGVTVTTDNVAAVAGADLVVAAVKPHAVLSLFDDVSRALQSTSTVISLAAGITTAAIEAHVPNGTPVVRSMPNTPAQIGAGITAIAPGASATQDHMDRARRFLTGAGDVVEVVEKDMDAVTALSGGGPAYTFLVIETLIEAGVHAGLTRQVATRLAQQTVLGTAQLAIETGDHPALLRERVTSPGGTTAAGLRALENYSVRAAFLAAVEAARCRSQDLGG